MTPGQRFTGKERDGETGLDYFGARYMSGAQGRFSSPDPGGFSGKHARNPQKWNRYSYVLNIPLAYIDPDGFEELKITISTGIPWPTTSMWPLPLGTYNGGDKLSASFSVETTRRGNPLISGPREITKPNIRHAGALLGLLGEARGVPKPSARINGVTLTGANSQKVNFQMNSKNPTVPLPDFLTVGIYADLDFEFDEAATFLSVQGTISSFPSFNISVTRENGQTIPVYQSGSPNLNTAYLLFWSKPVSTMVDLKEPRGCVGIGNEKPVCEP